MGRGTQEKALDPALFFVIQLEVAGLFCHHIKALAHSNVSHNLGHCMENPSRSFRNLLSSFLFFFPDVLGC